MKEKKTIKAEKSIDLNTFKSALSNEEYKQFLIKAKKELNKLATQIISKNKLNLQIPSSILSHKKLGSLEAVVKYLKENKKKSLKEIANLLNKKYTTITNTYRKSILKEKPKLKIKKTNNIFIPVYVFEHSNLGPLESLIVYLKDTLKLKNSVIAKLLNKSEKTIWSSYHNAQLKLGQNE